MDSSHCAAFSIHEGRPPPAVLDIDYDITMNFGGVEGGVRLAVRERRGRS